MHLNGKLRPKPTSRLFLQDAVSGGRALMERPAALRATWARGRLRVAYRGPCYCSKDVVPHGVEINQCVGCMRLPCWLRRVVGDPYRHAVEKASRRWRGGRRDDSAEHAVNF